MYIIGFSFPLMKYLVQSMKDATATAEKVARKEKDTKKSIQKN